MWDGTEKIKVFGLSLGIEFFKFSPNLSIVGFMEQKICGGNVGNLMIFWGLKL